MNMRSSTRQSPRLCSKNTRDTVPRVGDDIKVLFQLQSGRRVWCPGTVQDVHDDADEQGLTHATVIYHAAHGQVQQSTPVKFSPEGRLLTRTEEWIEAAWMKHDSDPTCAE